MIMMSSFYQEFILPKFNDIRQEKNQVLVKFLKLDKNLTNEKLDCDIRNGLNHRFSRATNGAP